jgi:predicted nucleic acid-binding protein
MGPRRPRAVVLDSGALIAFEKNDRRVRTLIELALAHGAPLWTAGAVVAQVWRDGSRQARLARLLGSGLVQVQPLDREEAQATGVLCGEAGTKDVVDASVVLLARKYAATIVTSDPDDLRRIDPAAQLVTC